MYVSSSGGACNSCSITLSTFSQRPNPHSPISTPLISFKTGTRNLVIALINNIKIHMYVITGTSVVLVGQSSFNLVESRYPGDKKNPACIHNMQSDDTIKRIFPYLFIYIYIYFFSFSLFLGRRGTFA